MGSNLWDVIGKIVQQPPVVVVPGAMPVPVPMPRPTYDQPFDPLHEHMARVLYRYRQTLEEIARMGGPAGEMAMLALEQND
jgi:hypothetical protein